MSAMRCAPLRSRAGHIVQFQTITVSQDAHDFSKYRPKIHPPNSHPMFLSSLRLVRTGVATPCPLSLPTLYYADGSTCCRNLTNVCAHDVTHSPPLIQGEANKAR